MKKLFFQLALTFAFTAFWGCEKSGTNDSPNREEETHHALVSFAKLLIGDANSQGIFRQKQVELYAKTKNEEFPILDLQDAGSSERTPSVITNLIASNPLMKVAYPSFAFQTAQTFSQYINNIQYYVILDESTDVDAVSTLPAYDASGNATTVSSTFDETIKYAVIKIEEAYDAVRSGETVSVKGQTIPASLSSFSPYRTDGTTKIYEEAAWINAQRKDDGPIAGGTVTERGPTASCPNNRPRKDQLYKIRFSNKDAVKVIESGFHLPEVELFATYVFATVNAPNATFSVDAVTVQVVKNWSLMNGGDWASVDNINQQIKTWDALDSDTWKVAWIERDTNNDSENAFTFGFTPTYTVNTKWAFSSPVSFSIKLKKKDKVAGDVLMEYCDTATGEGTAYKVYTGGNDGMYYRENMIP